MASPLRKWPSRKPNCHPAASASKNLAYKLVSVFEGFATYSSWPPTRHMKVRFRQSFPLSRQMGGLCCACGAIVLHYCQCVQFRTMIHDITPLGDALTSDLRDIFAKARSCVRGVLRATPSTPRFQHASPSSPQNLLVGSSLVGFLAKSAASGASRPAPFGAAQWCRYHPAWHER